MTRDRNATGLSPAAPSLFPNAGLLPSTGATFRTFKLRSQKLPVTALVYATDRYASAP